MKQLNVTWKVVLGYAIVILAVVGGALLLQSGKDVRLYQCPMLLLDVLLIVVFLPVILVQDSVGAEFALESTYRVERKRFYEKRRNLLTICRIVSTAIVVAFKYAVVVQQGVFEGIDTRTTVLYCLVVGLFYGVLVWNMILGIDWIASGWAAALAVLMAILFVTLTSLNIQVPAILPKDTLVAAIATVALIVLMRYVQKRHKDHYEMMDC